MVVWTRYGVAALVTLGLAVSAGADDRQALVDEIGRADALAKEGRFAEAVPVLERVLREVPAAFGAQSPEVANVASRLGTAYERTARHAKAASAFRTCLDLRSARLGNDHIETAVARNNLAYQLYFLGQFAESERLFAAALPVVARTYPDHPFQALVCDNLAFLHQHAGASDKAKPLFDRAATIRKNGLGEDHPAYAQSLRNVGLLLMDAGKPDEAEPYIRKSMAIWEAHADHGPNDRKVAISATTLARIERGRGRTAQALALFERAERIMLAKGVANDPEAAHAAANVALCLSGANRAADAVAAMDRARRIGRTYVARNLMGLPEPEQLTFVRTDQQQLHDGLRFGLLRPTDAATVRATAEWLLNGKAAALEAAANGAVTGPEVRAVREQMARLTVAGARAGRDAEYRAELARLTERERSLLAASGLAADAGPVRWTTLDEVRRALGDGSVLIETVKLDGAGRYAAWVVTRDAPVQVVDLGPADAIDAAVGRFQKQMATADERIKAAGEPDAETELRVVLSDLGNRLLKPLRPFLGPRTDLIVGPDANLWFVPWSALVLDGARYAIEDYSFRYVVSGRDPIARPDRGGAETAPLIVANPTFDAEPGAAPVRSADTRSASGLLAGTTFGPLPGTALEAEAVRPLLEKVAGREPRLLSEAAARESVVKEVRSPKMLHIGTHGFSLETAAVVNPLLRCGLAFAGANRSAQAPDTGSDDGILTGLEIVGLDLARTELVVLSACQTGLGDAVGGEGVVGLRFAFQYAGCRSVIATLWQIPDQQSATLIAAFYRDLVGGRDHAAALRSAQIGQIAARRKRNAAAHPYYWAAFTLTGRGR